MESIMQVRTLSKNYGSVRAVDSIDFEIPEGVCFGLLGPNGAGKTTTIEMMEGILEPTAGEILFRGKPIDRHFKEKVGIQFQSTALPEYITVKETLELFEAFYPNPRPQKEVIEICSLGDIIDRDNRKLSGGQRQRLLLALAIIPYPEIVFLDEPTTGLDPQARRNFWSLIEKIRAENTTVLLTTHYMEEAQLLCDQIAIMDHGHILELDTPERLLDKHFEGVVVRIPRNGHENLFIPNREEASVQSALGDHLPHGRAPVLPADALTANARINGDFLEIVTSNLDRTIKELMALDADLDGLSIHKPNLEDLFIQLTGSSLRA